MLKNESASIQKVLADTSNYDCLMQNFRYFWIYSLGGNLCNKTRHSYVYMLPIAGQTTGPNGLKFFVDTQGWPNFFSKTFFSSFYCSTGIALQLVTHKTLNMINFFFFIFLKVLQDFLWKC